MQHDAGVIARLSHCRTSALHSLNLLRQSRGGQCPLDKSSCQPSLSVCSSSNCALLLQIVNETLPAMVKLRESGKVKCVGISGLPLATLRQVVERAPPGTLDVVLSYCHYSLNDTSLTSLVPLLEERGIGVINASPFSMGLLTPQGPPAWHPAPQALQVSQSPTTQRCRRSCHAGPALQGIDSLHLIASGKPQLVCA